MLKLRRGTVVSTDPLRIEVDGGERPAWADRSLVGEIELGDEVIVNTEALDLGLGSGGFDLVHANLTRGLSAEGAGGRHAMKLNYTSLQHPVEPVERPLESGSATRLPVLVWDAILAGPGPGILGSATRYGHGGAAALDTAHAALALGMRTLLSPRLSGADPRPRHRGLSHHTAAVLELLLAPVQVPVPEVEVAEWPTPEGSSDAGPEPGMLDDLREACGERHDLVVQPVDLEGYASSGLPTWTMGREIGQDRLFFAAGLASGPALGAGGGGGGG